MKFPPFFCIVYPENPWKRKRLEKHFRERELEVNFILGINQKTSGLNCNFPFDTNSEGKPFFVSSCEIAKIISQRIAITVALNSGASEFVIADDDVFISEDIIPKWKSLKDSLSPDASIIQLQYLDDDNIQLHPINEFYARSIPFPFCSNCIWWRADAARQAIYHLWSFDRPYDIMLIQRTYPHLVHFVADPPLAFKWDEVEHEKKA